MAREDNLAVPVFRGLTNRPGGRPEGSVVAAGGGRIWIVDDSPLQLERAGALLAAHHQVTCFSEGETMLERLAGGERPDVLLLDRQLPGLSGLEICGFLRERHDEVSLPILMLTVRGERNDFADGLAAGANDYLAKPYDDAELLARVRTLVRVRQQAETLRLREAWQGAILTSIGEAVIATDPTGRITFVNPVAERLTGWSREEVQDRPSTEIFRILDERTRAPAASPVERVLRGGETTGFANHTLLVRKDGSEVAIDNSAAPVQGASGELTGVVLVFRDITEKRRAEAERASLFAREKQARREAEAETAKLQESEERLRRVVEASGTGTWEMDVATENLITDGRFRALFGLPIDQSLTLAEALSLIDEEDRERVARAVADALAGKNGGQYRQEYRTFRGADGRRQWVEARGQSRVGPDGTADRLVGTGVDITARKEAEAERADLLARAQAARAAAEEEQRKLHSIFMQAPVAICILEGPEHTFTFANPAYRTLVGGRDLLGKPLREALPELRGGGFDAMVDRVLATGEPFFGTEHEVKLEHEGEDRCLIVNFTYQPKRNAAGEVDGILAVVIDVTEQVEGRRRIEALAERLRENEAELRMVTDHLPVLVSFVDRDERYRFANKAYEGWFGLPAERLEGHTVREVIGEAAYAVLGPHVRRGLAGERFTFEQHDVPYRHGGTRDVRVTFVPSRNDTGDVEGYVALLEDISERRRLEQERDRFARQYSDVLESMDEAFFALDKEWRLILMNASHEQVSGLRREDALGRNFWEVFPTAPGSQRWLECHRCMIDRVAVQFVEYDEPLDRWTLVRAHPTPDGGIAALVRDVSQEKRLDTVREELLRSLGDQPLLYTALLRGPELVFEAANGPFREVVGGRDVVGKTLAEALPELHDQGFDAILTRVLVTGEPFVGREVQMRLDRRGRGVEPGHFNFVYQAVRGPRGANERVLVIGQDVTDEVLARRDALQRARDRADFEQQLIGIVSHDLRNPLHAIRMATAALARRDELDEGASKSVMRIQASAERMSRLVGDLLDFTQARLGGGIPISPAPMDLSALVRQVLDEVEASHPEREVRVQEEGNAQGVWDADRLAQVVQNLVANAVTYSLPQSPVSVRTRGEPDHVALEIHNHGVPIPNEALGRLFHPMQRASTRGDKAGRSVGLGLYIVKHLVDAHGGTIDVRSSSEDGTTFTVRLPRRTSYAG